MSNHLYLLTGAALLMAGAAHGAATNPQMEEMEKEAQRAEQMLTLEPPASIATTHTSKQQSNAEEPAKLLRSAKPVYNNGGYFGELGE